MLNESQFDLRPHHLTIVFGDKPAPGKVIDADNIHVGDKVLLRQGGQDVHVKVTSVDGDQLTGCELEHQTEVSFTLSNVFRCLRFAA